MPRRRSVTHTEMETEELVSLEQEELGELEEEQVVETQTPEPILILPTQKQNPAPTGIIFLGEEDKRLLKKFNKKIVNELGLNTTRSIKL